MTRAEFDAITVVATPAAALLLAETTKGGDPTKFLFSTNPAGTVNSQQGKGVGDPDSNRVTYFERLPQEKCCGTHGIMPTPHSASLGYDMVYHGPYPGLGHAGYAIKHTVLTD